jgi:hypothetical protein
LFVVLGKKKGELARPGIKARCEIKEQRKRTTRTGLAGDLLMRTKQREENS